MNTQSFFRPLAFAAFVAIAATISLTSCDKDVVLKTLDVKIVSEMVLDVKATDPLAAVWVKELDPNSNVDVRDNRNKIKKVVVEKLAYRVNEFIGPAATKGSGTWKFYLTDTPAQVFTLGTVTNLDLAAAQAAKTVYDLPLAEDGKAKLVEAINGNQKVTFVFDGSVSDRPTYTRFEVQVFTKIDVGV
ncbi:MAG: hypothetical protein H7330_02410 [Hymenobacteraceae bacterium]|nr:hypothetical protein [Hymenobacteraceae bacterium]